MPNWIETSLQAAVTALTRSGDVDIASSLGRLLDEPEVRTLKLYRSQEAASLADAICDCDELEELTRLLGDLASVFSVAHCTIHRLRERHIGGYGAKILSTYPESWIEEYIDRRYFGVDPVVARALEGTGLFFWDELPADGPVVAGFLRSAAKYGVGPAGITLVGDNQAGDTFAISLAAPLSPGDFRGLFTPKLADFTDIASLLIEVFSDLTCIYREGGTSLTLDQIRMLRTLAQGLSPADLGGIQVSYGSIATLETSILRTLNAASLTQAVAIAVKGGLLETVPFFEDDLFRPEGKSAARRSAA